MSEQKTLTEKMQHLKVLQVKAKNSLSPFAKAAIAEQAVGVSIDVIEELVNREVARDAST